MCLHFWRGAIVGAMAIMLTADLVVGTWVSAAIDAAVVLGFVLFEVGIHYGYQNRPDYVTVSAERYEL